MKEIETIFKALDIITEEKLWDDKKPSEILRILLYVHNKGWLYTPTSDGEVVAIICAYRIKEINEDGLRKLPLDEDGKILYVPFVLSIKKDDNLFHIVREACSIYLNENRDIEEIVLEDKNQKIKRYNLKKTLQGV